MLGPVGQLGADAEKKDDQGLAAAREFKLTCAVALVAAGQPQVIRLSREARGAEACGAGACAVCRLLCRLLRLLRLLHGLVAAAAAGRSSCGRGARGGRLRRKHVGQHVIKFKAGRRGWALLLRLLRLRCRVVLVGVPLRLLDKELLTAAPPAADWEAAPALAPAPPAAAAQRLHLLLRRRGCWGVLGRKLSGCCAASAAAAAPPIGKYDSTPSAAAAPAPASSRCCSGEHGGRGRNSLHHQGQNREACYSVKYMTLYTHMQQYSTHLLARPCMHACMPGLLYVAAQRQHATQSSGSERQQRAHIQVRQAGQLGQDL